VIRPKSLDVLLKPRSVAIVGASNDQDRLAGLPLKYLKQGGYKGEIFPINPTRKTVQGLKAYASVAALPQTPDVAIIVVRLELVQQAVEECAARGVGAAMIFTTGYGESGEAGRQAQETLLTTARGAGMRLLGPNCLGCFNSAIGFYGTFSISLSASFPVPGNVAIVSQSGAYGEQVGYLARQRGLGLHYFISTGNEVDLDVAEAIAWLAEQPGVDVIIAYAEGSSDARRLTRALERAQAADKQIIFVKAGQSTAGAAAARSHTAALAGDDRIWDAVFRRYGVYRAHSAQEQIDVAYAAARRIFPTGNRLGILTVSGGFGILLCDASARHGLETTPLPIEVEQRLRRLFPFGSIQNPLDTSGQVVAQVDRLPESLRLLIRDAGYDAVIAFLGTLPLASIGPPMMEAMIASAPSFSNRLVVLCMLGNEQTVRAYEGAGFLVFPDTEQAIRAIAGLMVLGEGRERARHCPAPVVLPPPVTMPQAPLSEHAAKIWLAQAGVPIYPEKLVHSTEHAVAAAKEFGFPVAMKISSPIIVHKTEIGGVLLGVADAESVRAGFGVLLQRAIAAGYGPDTIEGILIAPMAPRGIETILGVQVDPTFGATVLFGLGGIHVEVLKDTALRLAPIDEQEARSMIAEIRGAALLLGIRGAAAADISALARALAALSRFAAANADQIASIDINPFIVWKDGQGAAAVDAFIGLRTPVHAKEKEAEDAF
jgi:acyl-CoA synthetase (NDP forming)